MRRPVAARRRALVVVLASALGLVGGCGDSTPPDTAPVVLTSGRASAQGWRIEGRRLGGEPCVSLILEGADRPSVGRCGEPRSELRHLVPVMVTVDDRLLVFSSVPARAVRVRLDTADGAIRIEPARPAAGFPYRFFVFDLDPGVRPSAVRVFAEGGRAVVT